MEIFQTEKSHLIKVVRRLEDVGQKEVEQGPQLRQIVLQRRASQEQAARSMIVLRQNLQCEYNVGYKKCGLTIHTVWN